MELFWTAVYKDGTFLNEINEDETTNSYGDIVRNDIIEFHLRRKENGSTVLAMEISEGQRLIYRKRNSISGTSGELNWTIYMAGWQQTIGGKNIQSINWIFPDGSIINTGRFQENHPIFYSITLLPFELEEEENPSWQDGDDG